MNVINNIKLKELIKTSINYDLQVHAIKERRRRSIKNKNFLKHVEEFLIYEDEHFSIGLPFRDASAD